ncbi:MAG: ComF family protein [Candidatus Paceibacterota bacterium]
MLKKLIHTFLNFLLPQKCLGCGKENEALCRECLAKIDMPSLPKEGEIFSAADYGDETAKKAIWMLKYRGAKNLAEPLAELLNTRCSTKLEIKNAGDWLVVPLPLSKERLRERGYNQAELIAGHLSQKIKIPVCADALVKIKNTPAQVSIKNRKERLNNLKGAFAIKNPETIFGKNIILIDDVSTTGATIREAKKTLKVGGAKKVIALVVARG